MANNNEQSRNSPPYIPWETLKGFLKAIKDSTVPNRMDTSMMPSSMSGFSKAGVTSTLKFFSLIDSDGTTTKELKTLVDALDTNHWSDIIKSILVPAYTNIIGDLRLDKATKRELEEKFGNSSSEMKDRFIRFYIPMMKDAGQEISPYITVRQNKPRKSGTKKSAKKLQETPRNEDRPIHIRHSASTIPEGMIALPLFPPPRQALIPSDITEADCDALDVMMRAYAKRAKE